MSGRLFNSPQGRVIISILWGLGIATLFKGACKNNCIVVRAADPDSVSDKVYQVAGKDGAQRCVRFKPRFVDCPDQN